MQVDGSDEIHEVEDSADLLVLYAALEGTTSQRTWNALVAGSESAPDLRHADLEGYDLRGLDFVGCDLSHANLKEVRAEGVSFDAAKIDSTCFRGAQLNKAVFRRAVGTVADFSGADMECADLSWALLKGSLFDDVDLHSVRLWKSDLRGCSYPRFEPNRDQDFLSDTSTGPELLHLRELLARVGGLTERKYRLDRGVSNAQVEVPRDLQQNPIHHLTEVLKRSGLSIRATHLTEHQEVVYVVCKRE